jgi:hypothetical protein
MNDELENKSRVLPYLLFYRNVCLSLILHICILAIHSRFIGCLSLEKSISNQGTKVPSCRPQAKIINRAVGEVCKCLRSARALSEQGSNTFFSTGTTSLKKVKKRWLYS